MRREIYKKGKSIPSIIDAWFGSGIVLKMGKILSKLIFPWRYKTREYAKCVFYFAAYNLPEPDGRCAVVPQIPR